MDSCAVVTGLRSLAELCRDRVARAGAMGALIGVVELDSQLDSLLAVAAGLGLEPTGWQLLSTGVLTEGGRWRSGSVG